MLDTIEKIMNYLKDSARHGACAVLNESEVRMLLDYISNRLETEKPIDKSE